MGNGLPLRMMIRRSSLPNALLDLHNKAVQNPDARSSNWKEQLWPRGAAAWIWPVIQELPASCRGGCDPVARLQVRTAGGAPHAAGVFSCVACCLQVVQVVLAVARMATMAAYRVQGIQQW
jgi:hypothetical protein